MSRCTASSDYMYMIQSLKCSIFQFLRSITVRSPFVHHAFNVPSSFVHRLQVCVLRSPCACIYRLQSFPRSLNLPLLSFLKRSPSFCVRVCARFAFCVRSLFIVHISFTKLHSQFTHRSLCVRSAFSFRLSASAHRSSWKVEGFRDCNTI